MSEELKAITLESSIENILDIIKVFGKQKDGRYIITENALNAIEQALTPPTADEVAKALGEYFNDNVIYEKEDKGFTFSKYSPYICHIENEIIIINYIKLPPHLITMIGRFYESESE